jgi:hypothetical protein
VKIEHTGEVFVTLSQEECRNLKVALGVSCELMNENMRKGGTGVDDIFVRHGVDPMKKRHLGTIRDLVDNLHEEL